MAKIFTLETKDVALICLCYLENATPAQLRYAARRIRRRAPEARVLVNLFGESDHIGGVAPHLYAGVELVAGSLRDSVERIAEIARQRPQQPHITPAPTVKTA